MSAHKPLCPTARVGGMADECRCKEVTSLHEAIVEAQRRWGRAGFARVTDGQCYVGTIGGELLSNGTFAYGCGWTWIEAFADSDKRAVKR